MNILERAKRRRARDLLRQGEIVAACACEYPIRVFRNGHGHASDCPAVPVIARHKTEDHVARMEAADR